MTRIAILGWGSLIWDPQNLCYNGEWYKDGPSLPVEFARISEEGILTLVLYSNAKKVQVLWTYSNKVIISEAMHNLSEREKCPIESIGFIDLKTQESRCEVVPELKNEIVTWAKGKKFDAVVWTELSSNFSEKRNGKKFNEGNVFEYLNELYDNKIRGEKAEEYFYNTYHKINTGLNEKIDIFYLAKHPDRKSYESLVIDELRNSIDYLEMSVRSLIESEHNPYSWKWVVLGIHGALYGFGVCAVAGTDYNRVMKGKDLKSFGKIMEMSQEESCMKQLCISQTLVLTKEQKKAIDFIHKELRNKLEHFIPKLWGIELSGIPKMIASCFEVIEFLALESNNILFMDNLRDRVKSLCQSGKSLALSSKINLKIDDANHQ